MNLYAIVEHPGQDSEKVVHTGLSYHAAVQTLTNNYTKEEQGDLAQIMKEGPEGLTTEF